MFFLLNILVLYIIFVEAKTQKTTVAGSYQSLFLI